MQRSLTAETLRRLRNDVDFQRLFEELDWPHKWREGQLAFVCPKCREYASAVNPRTNLARCFWCRTNFNPIDFVMMAGPATFLDAVHCLDDERLFKKRADQAPPK